MNIVFAGTPDFAAEHLSALIESPHNIIAVLTQPDRPSGRGQKVHKSAVKQVAENHNIPIHQPVSLKNNEVIFNTLKECNADFMIVVAYGLILPEPILTLPKFGCLNVHASLLPRWRGSAPIHRAIEAGDEKSGVCIMQMDKGLDTGDVLSVAETMIDDEDNLQTLHDRLAKLGCKTLLKTLEDYPSIKATRQNNDLANYAEKITKAETLIDWQHPSQQIFNKIRGFCPWPIATTKHKEITLRIWQASLVKNDTQLHHDSISKAKAGEVISIDKNAITVKTGDGVIHIHSIQKPGSKSMNISNFINGYAIEVGDFFE